MMMMEMMDAARDRHSKTRQRVERAKKIHEVACWSESGNGVD
jgi:hypothetical protein